MWFLLVWVAFGVVTGLAAQARGRSFIAWLGLGCVFGVFGLLAVLVMNDVRLERARAADLRPKGAAADGPVHNPVVRRPVVPEFEYKGDLPEDGWRFVETFRGYRLDRHADKALFRANGRLFPDQEAARRYITFDV